MSNEQLDVTRIRENSDSNILRRSRSRRFRSFRNQFEPKNGFDWRIELNLASESARSGKELGMREH